MAKDPAFLFYPSDFLTGTAFMTDDQIGKYIRLLCLQHQHGRLKEIHMLNICKTYDEDIFSKFEKDQEGLFFNRRLEEESLKRKAYSESRRRNIQKRYEATYVDTHEDTYEDCMKPHMENRNINKDLDKDLKISTLYAEEIFSYWQSELNHPHSKLDAKRRKAINARIKEGYEVDRIKQAIRGIKRSPHNMGQNDRSTVYDDIELICRSGANVDRFADLEVKQTPNIDMSRYSFLITKGGNDENRGDEKTIIVPNCEVSDSEI